MTLRPSIARTPPEKLTTRSRSGAEAGAGPRSSSFHMIEQITLRGRLADRSPALRRVGSADDGVGVLDDWKLQFGIATGVVPDERTARGRIVLDFSAFVTRLLKRGLGRRCFIAAVLGGTECSVAFFTDCFFGSGACCCVDVCSPIDGRRGDGGSVRFDCGGRRRREYRVRSESRIRLRWRPLCWRPHRPWIEVDQRQRRRLFGMNRRRPYAQ